MAVMIKQDKYIVVIFEDDGVFMVAPGQLLANAEDEITFQNLTTHSVTIRFEDEKLLDCKEQKLGTGQVNEPPQDKKLPVKKGVNVGSYPYDVFVSIKGEEVPAQASRPIIIIYRKLV